MHGYKEKGLVVLFLLVFLAVCYLESTGDIHDNRSRINTVRQEFSNLKDAQHRERKIITDAKRSIATSEKRVTRSTKRIAESERKNEELRSIERRDTELIKECQQILRRVRQRGETKEKTP